MTNSLFLNNNPIPTPQKGEIVNFKRRSPDESNLNLCSDGNLEETAKYYLKNYSEWEAWVPSNIISKIKNTL